MSAAACLSAWPAAQRPTRPLALEMGACAGSAAGAAHSGVGPNQSGTLASVSRSSAHPVPGSTCCHQLSVVLRGDGSRAAHCARSLPHEARSAALCFETPLHCDESYPFCGHPLLSAGAYPRRVSS